MSKRKIKNFILKTITAIAAIGFGIFVNAIDSPSWIPTIICVVCMIWLTLFAYANITEKDYEFDE